MRHFLAKDRITNDFLFEQNTSALRTKVTNFSVRMGNSIRASYQVFKYCLYLTLNNPYLEKSKVFQALFITFRHCHLRCVQASKSGPMIVANKNLETHCLQKIIFTLKKRKIGHLALAQTVCIQEFWVQEFSSQVTYLA